MPATMIVEFPNGQKVLFGGRGAAKGLTDVSAANKIATATSKQLTEAFGSLGAIVSALENSLGSVAKRPEKVEMEFRAALTANCDLWIVSGEGEAEIKVTVGWGKDG